LIFGPQETSWCSIKLTFVATGAKLGEIGGFIVDGVKRIHSGGRIFTP
jgi:hypothetical protein